MRMAIMAGLALAACAPKAETPVEVGSAPITGACDAAKVQDLLGKPAAGVSGYAKARSGAKVLRTYVTGAPVTMDYSADRLNIETDANGAIVKLSCG